MPTLVRLRSLFLPASIGLLVLVAAGWYNLVWLPSEHKYLDDRNFRLLSTLSEEISSSINNFDKMMDNASRSGIKLWRPAENSGQGGRGDALPVSGFSTQSEIG